MGRIPALLLLASVLGVGLSAAQEREAMPRFRGGVQALQVDVIVTDEDGNFVPELEAEDFELYEDGERQKITTFGLVELPEPLGLPRFSLWPFRGLPELDYPVATNDGAENARLYALVLDDVNTESAFGPAVRWLAKEFVTEHVGPSDLVSIGYTSGLARGFTNDRNALVDAVDSFRGGRGKVAFGRGRVTPYAGSDDRRRFRFEEHGSWLLRTRVALSVLQEYCYWLESVRGRRKSLVWITEGFNYDFTNEYGDLIPDALTEEYSLLVDAAARANVAIYAFSPRDFHANGWRTTKRRSIPRRRGPIWMNGRPTQAYYGLSTARISRSSYQRRLMGHLERLESIRFLEDISRLSGGFAMTSPAEPKEHLERLVADSSRYYMLGFSPTDTPEADELRRIDVRVRREGVVVRTRYGYAVEPKDTVERAAEADMPSSLRDALSSPVPATGLTLRMAAVPLGGEDGNAIVPVVVQTDSRELGLQERDGFLHGNVELYVRALSHEGEVIAHEDTPITLRVPAAFREQLAEDGFRAMRVLRLEPGSYRIQSVVHEVDTGHVASVESNLEVPELRKATLRGVTLTSELESRIPVASDASDGWSRGYLPSPEPVFGRADKLLALVELANPKGKRRLQLNLQVLDEEASQVFFAVSPVQATDKGRPVVVSKEVPLVDFAPGQYRVAFRLQTRTGKKLAERQAAFTVR